MTARGTAAKAKRARTAKSPSRTAAKRRSLGAQLAEARDQQTATAEILRVISRSQADVQPVLATIARSARALCDAKFGNVYLLDGETISLAASDGLAPKALAKFASGYPRKIGPDTVTGRAALENRVVQTTDLIADPDYSSAPGSRVGARSVLGVPMLRHGKAIGSIGVWRDVVEPFSDSQVALLQTFADQAVIAIENVRLFKEREERNRDLTEALERQTATSDILRVISQSQTDAQPVFETIAAATMKLCRVSLANVFTFDGELIHLEAFASVNVRPEYSAAIRQNFPRPPGRDTAVTRAILTGGVVVIPDVLEEPEYAITAQTLAGGLRSVLAVPLIREGRPIGAIVIGDGKPGPFPDTQIALLQTFADQAVIAIENVRLFKELEARNRDLTEALEQQTATSDILRVISQSPRDVQPVFDTIAAAAFKLCRASSATLFTFDGELIRLASFANVNPEGADAVRRTYPRPPSRDTAATRAVLTGRVVTIPDVREDLEYAVTASSVAAGFRSVLSVPLIRNRSPIGAISVGKPEPGLFPDEQTALLQTFADQAVIAIENVRLFKELEARNRELTEALEQQTATSDILRVISQSQTDVQPVFDTIAKSVLALCRAQFANVFTYDGKLVHLAAFVNVHPEYIDTLRSFYPRPPGRATAVTRAIESGSVCTIADVLADPEYQIAAASATGGFRSILAVPLMREGKAVGGIAVGRPEPGDFPESQVMLLQTFADQAVIAIENVRLFTELETRTTELTQSVGELKALGDVGQAVSSTLDLETVLSTIVSRATELAGLDGGSIWEYDDAREEFRLHATNRLPDELVGALRSTPIRKGQGALGRLAVTREPVAISDIARERTYPGWLREIVVRCGYRSVLAVPLLREDQLLGALAVNRSAAGEFGPAVIELMRTFASQSALAIQNARLFREIEIKSAELETASRHKSEFLANMSHELRTPLNAIIGFSEVLSEQMFGTINDKQAEYLQDILESGRHLLSLINDILDLSKIEAGRMELEPSDFDLPGAIENALILVRERANRHGITLAHTVDERLGPIRADERKVKQVLLNLLTNALKFTPEGGRIDVRARVQNGAAEISVTDTGIGIALEDQAAVFEEFRQVGTASKKVEGTGLGLAISRKFIELHGGTIGVTSKPGVGSTFAFTLPLPRSSHHNG